jgi:DNA ligase 1
MSKLVEVIKALQATASRLDKEEILSNAWNDQNFDLFTGLKYCYDPFITFGVADKTVDKFWAVGVEDPKSSFSDFIELAEKLRNRVVTGIAAQEEIQKFVSHTLASEWNLFYRPILLKDIRAGITSTTINKVLTKISKTNKEAKKYLIETFECQLAHDGVEETFEGEVILQEKLDGVRLIIICDIENSTVTIYTRNGKENTNFPHIKKVFEDLLSSLKTSMVFDGEVVGNTFQSLMKQVNRKDDVDSKNTKLALFDCLPLSDFKNGISEITQSQRLEIIDNFSVFSDKNEESPVFKLESLIVDMTTEEGKQTFNKFNHDVVSAGKEGIMVKKPNAPYECKRSKSWLKIKPFIEETLEIVDVEIGSGKNAGRLGNLLCKGFVKDKQIEVSVGSGFSEEQREEFWNRKESLKGLLIEVRADCLTKDQNSENVWSMRFPRFKGFRGTVPGEKI